MASRIVKRGAADERDQGRDLRQVEFLHRAAEIEMAREPKSMNGPTAVLAEINLIQISLQDLGFRISRLQQQRDQRFVHFSPYRALVAQEEILRELLSDGAATLHGGASTDVGDGSAQNRARRDAMVTKERAVLDRNQRADQQRRHVLEPEQNAVFTVQRVNASDQRGIEARDRQRLP